MRPFIVILSSLLNHQSIALLTLMGIFGLFTSTQAEDWKGTVLNVKTGDPVEGAFVCVVDPASKKINPAIFSMTDSTGSFAIKAGDENGVTLCAMAHGFAPKTVAVNRSKDGVTEHAKIELARGGFVIEGKVIDSEGKAIEGALIKIDDLVRAHSDASGRYRADRVPTVARSGPSKGKARPAIYPVVSHPNYIAKDSFKVDIDIAAGKMTMDFILEKGGILEGTVTAKDDGRPLSGVEVVIGDSRFASNIHRASATTDKNGHYLITGSPIGSQFVHVLSDDWAPAMSRATILPGATVNQDFSLEPGGDVSGKVVDVTGKPVEKVWIVTDTWQNARVFRRETYTDKEGNFTLPHMPTTPVQMDILKSGFTSIRNFVIEVGQKDAVITLRGPAIISGRILDAKSKKPITTYRPARATLMPGQKQLFWTEAEGRSNPEGTFKLTESEFANGTLMIQFRAEGYRAGPEPSIALRAGDVRENLEIFLEPSEPIIGVIRDHDGKEVPGATVRFFPLTNWTAYPENFDPMKLSDRDFTSTSDASGQFNWKGAESSSYGIFAFKLGVGGQIVSSLDKQPVGRPVEISLVPFSSIEGFVYRGSKPQPGAEVKVTVDRRHSDSLPTIFTQRYQPHATTDANGAYRIDNIMGNIAYTCYLQEATARNLPGRFARMENIFTPAGERVACIFGGDAGARLHGRVIAPDGSAAPGAEVSLSAVGNSMSKHYATRATSDGEYAILDLPPGKYNLRAQGTNQNSSPQLFFSRVIQIQPNADVAFDIPFVTRKQIIAGTILDGIEGADLANKPLIFDSSPKERSLLWFFYPGYEPSLAHAQLLKEAMPALRTANVRVIVLAEEFEDAEKTAEVLKPLGMDGKEFLFPMKAERTFYRNYMFPNQRGSPLVLLDSKRKVLAVVYNRAELDIALKEQVTP